MHSSDIAAHEDRVTAFKKDLYVRDLRDIVRKHITTGDPVVIRPDTYYELRRDVASKFNIHPNSVVLVGSCRLGFSLKPERRYQPIQASFDVDVTIISAALFDFYWDRVFDVWQNNIVWRTSPDAKKFKTNLLRGWIDPRVLPNLPSLAMSQDWAEFFDKLSRRQVCGRRWINARLYRTWDRLEAYQEIMVLDCLNDLKRNQE